MWKTRASREAAHVEVRGGAGPGPEPVGLLDLEPQLVGQLPARRLRVGARVDRPGQPTWPGHGQDHASRNAAAARALLRRPQARGIVTEIENKATAQGARLEPVREDRAIQVTGRGVVSYVQIARTMLREYPSRSFLGFSMMVTQALLYNAIFFTYALVLTNFYHTPSDRIGLYFFPFAAGNLLGTPSWSAATAARSRRSCSEASRTASSTRRTAPCS